LTTLSNTDKLSELIEANTALTEQVADLAEQIHAHIIAA
jgi:hypothetical protein